MTDFIKTICALAEVNATSFLQQIIVYLLYKNGQMSLGEIQANSPSITIYRATLDMLIQKGIAEKTKLSTPIPSVRFNLCADLRAQLDRKLKNGINPTATGSGICK